MQSALSIPALCLALGDGFLPPLPGRSGGIFRNGLANELTTLAEDEALDISEQVLALRSTRKAYGEGNALLVHYSCLFLIPPVHAPLNLGYYIDGRIDGPALAALQRLQERYGRCELEGFRDLPDHLSSVLELQAILFALPDAANARFQLAQQILLPGLLRLGQAIADESGLNSPYLHLVRIAQAVLQYAVPANSTAMAEDPCRQPARTRPRQDKFAWRGCHSCHRPYAREQELQVMEKVLQVHNHPVTHLSLCPFCRHVALGRRAQNSGNCNG